MGVTGLDTPLQGTRQTPGHVPQGLQHPFQVASGVAMCFAQGRALPQKFLLGLCILKPPTLQSGHPQLPLSPSWRLACFWGTLPANLITFFLLVSEGPRWPGHGWGGFGSLPEAWQGGWWTMGGRTHPEAGS